MTTDSTQGSKPSGRRFRRASLAEKVSFKPRRSPNIGGVVRDVSEGGAYLVAMQHFMPGTDLVLYLPLRLGKKSKMCIVSGKITRVEAGESTMLRGYGVQFDDEIAVSARSMLQDYVSLRLHGTLSKREPTPDRPEPTPVARLRLQRAYAPGKKKGETSAKELMVEALQRETTQIRRIRRRNRARRVRNAFIGSAVAIVLLAFGGMYAYRSIKRAMFISSLSDQIPMLDAKIEDGRLKALASKNWIKTVRKPNRKAQLEDFAVTLLKNNIFEAVLSDQDGQVVARILRNSSDTTRPQVQLYQ